MKKCIYLAILALIPVFVSAQTSTTIPLPEDVRHGTLKNGMTYYIMHNDETKDRVSFYFPQKVGAILEEDDEDGLAHFLEHMAFNGSENFKGKEMSEYLEAQGLKFGRDLNAYTSLDETLYNIDNIPTTNSELVDKCLLILHDWSGSLSLLDEEIDNERGVIKEEWRSSRSADMRIMKKSMPVKYAGSKYAERDIIGDPNFIQTFKYQSLKNYYKKWYRPDLQAVIVVGDINVDDMEKKVKTLFSKIPMPKNAKERTYYDVPESKETQYILVKDKESSNIAIEWGFRQKSAKVKDERSMRNDLITDLFYSMLNKRYNEQLQKPEASLAFAIGYNEDLTPFTQNHLLSIVPKKGSEFKGIEDAYREIERVMRFGFLESEFERSKQEIISFNEERVSNEDRTSNSFWARALNSHFNSSNPFMKAKDLMDFTLKTLSTIKLEEVNAMSNAYKNLKNSFIQVSGPEDASIKYPSKQDLLAIVNKIEKEELKPFFDNFNEAPLVTDELAVLPIKNTFAIKNISDAKGYVLNNGLKVVLMPSKEKGEYVTMQGTSFGGLSKVADENLAFAKMSPQYVKLSGLGAFDAAALKKKNAGRNARVSRYLEDYTENMSGNSTVKDIEVLLQMAYLSFEHPRFDKALLASQFPSWRDYVERTKKDSKKIFRDTLQNAFAGYHPRKKDAYEKVFDNFDFEKSEAIYKERFSDADDFTFIFIGNFDADTTLPLLQKYLGNIPSTSATETWEDRGVRQKKGLNKINFSREMSTPQTTISYNISVKEKYSLENQLMVTMLSNVLKMRYAETIREQEGGSYGVRVYNNFDVIPEAKYTISIQFDCNPKLSEKLLQIVKEEIQTLAKKGPSSDFTEKIKKNLIKDRQEAIKKDDFWLSRLQNKLLYDRDYVSLETYQSAVESITTESVQKFAKRYFASPDVIEVVLNPSK